MMPAGSIVRRLALVLVLATSVATGGACGSGEENPVGPNGTREAPEASDAGALAEVDPPAGEGETRTSLDPPGEEDEVAMEGPDEVDGARLVGRVLDEKGEPVPFAEVRGWRRATPTGELDARTEADGTGAFLLEGLHGEVYVEARAAGRIPLDVLQGRVEADREVRGLRLRVAPKGALEGRVTSSWGAPVEGATVYAEPSIMRGAARLTREKELFHARAPGREATTGADGGFRIEGLPLHPLVVAAHHPQFAQWSGRAFPGEEPLEIMLPGGFALTGRVLAWDGEPARGAEVELRLRGSIASARCDEEGWFALEGLLPLSEGWLGIRAEGNAVHAVAPVTIDGTTAPSPMIIQLEVARSIAGRVVDHGGTPLAGIVLRVHGDHYVERNVRRSLAIDTTWEQLLGDAEVTSGADGTFGFHGLYDGVFTVSATRPGPPARSWFREVRPPAEDIVLTLDPDDVQDVTLEGVVLDAHTGRPVTAYWLTVIGRHPGGSTYNSPRYEHASETGAYEVGGLPPGEYGIYVDAPGFTSAGVAPVLRDAGRHRVELELAPARTVRLRVVDRDGRPVAGASVWVERQDVPGVLWLTFQPGSKSQSVSTTDEGEVLLIDVPAEALAVTVDVRGASKERAQQRFPLDLTLPVEEVVELRFDPERPPP